MIIGAQIVAKLFSGEVQWAKAVFNARGAIFFRAIEQHSEQKAEGISYEDNSKGNALAAVITRDAIEIRRHNSFSDEAVAAIVRNLISCSGVSGLSGSRVTYGGKPISIT